MTREMVRKIEDRKKWKNCNTEEGRRMYRSLNDELRKETETARELYWAERCREIEDMNKVDKVYQIVKELTWKKKIQPKDQEHHE